MPHRIATTCALTLSLLVSTMAQDGQRTPSDPGRTSAPVPKLIDPGFESFTLTRGPIFGWYSDDATYPNDPRFAAVTLTPDNQIKAEGQYSLRIEQDRPRPKERGQACLSQAVRLAKKGGPRRFDLSAQMRGGLRGPVSIQVYVWEPGNIVRTIAQRDVKVESDWKTTTLSFNVPGGYDQFGIWFYLPREDEVQLWLDDIRLTPRDK